MDTHVKILGVLSILGGAIGVCGALFIMLVFGVSASAVAIDGDQDAAFVLPILGLTGAALMIATLVISIPGIIIGYGIYRFRPWARIAGIVLAILSLMLFPLGTILGAYGLWVLLSKETERLFAPTATPI
jgi:hypothetical protein